MSPLVITGYGKTLPELSGGSGGMEPFCSLLCRRWVSIDARRGSKDVAVRTSRVTKVETEIREMTGS